MSNLLPVKLRQRIRGEYRARFLLTGASLAIAAATFLALALLPSLSVLFLERPGTLQEASVAQQDKADSSDLSRTKSILAQVSPVVTASSTATYAIMDALARKSAGIHIDSVSYENGITSTITVGGSGDSRTAIDGYKTKLQGDPIFSSVQLPVGDLVGSTGGRFTITLTGNF